MFILYSYKTLGMSYLFLFIVIHSVSMCNLVNVIFMAKEGVVLGDVFRAKRINYLF